ncbi:MAG: sigma-70 family RNA polymerase sigma factor [Burkholderiales bacterium]|nr:sigma-70 family RNA polymerase sigma factor [Burkholderiales bacterium]
MNAATTYPDDASELGPGPERDDGFEGAAACEDASDAVDAVDAGGAVPAHGSAAISATEVQLAAWIEAIVDRDERALAALYDATFSRVFGLVRRIVRDAALAEEVVEDAYFQVWRQCVRFDPARGKALTWVLAMARSRAIDALRREARFEHDPLEEDGLPETASPAPPGDELLDLARHRADLHQALMLLGAQPRQLVSMSFFRGLSHEEIAEQTKLPLGTVKSQIRRALLALREALGERDSRLLAS